MLICSSRRLDEEVQDRKTKDRQNHRTSLLKLIIIMIKIIRNN